MIIDAGLILEGGGTRCVFTAGVLDYFMEKELYFKHVYSVSASAYAALNYLSKQINRTRECNIDYMEKENIFTWRSLFTTGSVFNTGLLFDRLPNKEIPFDYDTFFASKQILTMSVTNMNTGEPMYISAYKDRKHLMAACQSSNCFPIITPIQYIDGVPVLDGGMADAVPITKAIRDGIERCVVVLTQKRGYRKKIKRSILISLRYYKYKNFVKTVNSRPQRYNMTLDEIDNMEQKEKVFLMNPELDPPRLIDRNKKKLEAFYVHGYEYARTNFTRLLNYLGIE